MSSHTKTKPFDLGTLKSYRATNVSTVHGKVGTGISWHLINAACETASEGIGTVYIQYEMTNSMIFERISRLGYDMNDMSFFQIYNPSHQQPQRLATFAAVNLVKNYINNLEFEVQHLCLDCNWNPELIAGIMEAFPNKKFTIGIKVQ